MKLGTRPLKCPHCGKWARSPEEAKRINHRAFVFSIKFAVVFMILLLSSIGISNWFEIRQTNQYISFGELEEYLQLYEEKYNIRYSRILYHFGDDSIAVNKEIDGEVVYYVYHTEELVVDINDDGKYITTKFCVVHEATHIENNTYPYISCKTKDSSGIEYWRGIPPGKQFSINLKEA